jgi:ubiquinone/menaquinone biosynthesis C-methylase UbiE
MRTTTKLAMAIIEKYIKEGDIAIDATAGNGNDTLALSNFVGASGKVYAFDIQEKAIERTRKLLAESSLFDNTVLICDSHERMPSYIEEKGEVSAVIFNLGYLPSGDKYLHTAPESSIQAIKESLRILRKNGIVSIVMYPGTETGKREKDVVFRYAQTLPPEKYHVCRCDTPNQPNTPPEILWIEVK